MELSRGKAHILSVMADAVPSPASLLPEALVAKARQVIEANRAAGRKIAVAESCTGGLVAAALTEIAGFREADVDYQAMRASGPGGQHVNKTDSAIRAVHRPTGLVAMAQEQRSQHANRKLAQLKLALMIAERNQECARQARQEEWSRNQTLERGNAVRTYVGEAFRLKA